MSSVTRTTSTKRVARVLAPAMVLALAACGSGPSDVEDEAPPAASSAAQDCGSGGEPVPVGVGILFIDADAALFLAEERGYFDEMGIDVEFQRFTSAQETVSLLATNELEVGTGSPTAGLYNSFRQGLPIKIVASKSTVVPPDFGGAGLVVRQDLWDSGEVRTVEDLEGRTIALNAVATTSSTYIIRALEAAGLSKDDVTYKEVPVPQMIPTFQNQAADAAWIFDPIRGALQAQGLATQLPDADMVDIAPGDPTSLLFYAPEFAETEAATCFMMAHLMGLRDYHDAIIAGNAPMEPIYEVLSENTGIPVETYPNISLPGVDPNGDVNVEALETLQEEWLGWEYMEEEADLSQNVDTSYLDAAIAELGESEAAG